MKSSSFAALTAFQQAETWRHLGTYLRARRRCDEIDRAARKAREHLGGTGIQLAASTAAAMTIDQALEFALSDDRQYPMGAARLR